MKRCPQCGRDYNDDSLSFCLDDGSELLFGPGARDEGLTAILSNAELPSELPTRAQANAATETSVLPAASSPDGQSRSTSSAEYMLGEIKRHQTVLAITAAILIVGIIAAAIGIYRIAS